MSVDSQRNAMMTEVEAEASRRLDWAGIYQTIKRR